MQGRVIMDMHPFFSLISCLVLAKIKRNAGISCAGVKPANLWELAQRLDVLAYSTVFMALRNIFVSL